MTEPRRCAFKHIFAHNLNIFLRETTEAVGNNQLTIFTGIDIRNILMYGAILGHILKNVPNAGFRLKRIDFCFAHAGIPTFSLINHITLPKIANLPPIKRTTEKNGVVVHTMSGSTTTFGSSLTISKFDNEQVGKFNLTITVAFSDRILFTKARMFAKPIQKLPYRNIGFFLGLLINRRLQGESTKQALMRP